MVTCAIFLLGWLGVRIGNICEMLFSNRKGIVRKGQIVFGESGC
jgi:hypothetical protein